MMLRRWPRVGKLEGKGKAGQRVEHMEIPSPRPSTRPSQRTCKGAPGSAQTAAGQSWNAQSPGGCTAVRAGVNVSTSERHR